MAIRKCPACQFERSHYYLDLKDDRLHKCDYCGLVFSESTNDDFESMYTAGYFSGSESNLGYNDYEGERESHEQEFRNRLKSILKKATGLQTLLDVGCASGHFLKIASENFVQVVGADISLDALRIAKKNRTKYEVVQCNLESLSFRNKCFDVITAYDVIEHLNEPHKSIDSIWKSLKPGGMIHLTVPNHNSLSRMLMGRFWYHYKPREHLSYFSAKSLINLLSICGFVRIEVQSYRTKFYMDHLLKRIKFYSKTLFHVLDFIARKCGVSKWKVSVPSGEIEAFAFRPGVRSLSKKLNEKSISLESMVICANCGGNLKANSSNWNCTTCQARFDLEDGIPRMIKTGQSQAGMDKKWVNG